MRSRVYEDLIKKFEAKDTIMNNESNNCYGSKKADFPEGLWGEFPIFMAPHYKTFGNQNIGKGDYTCVFTNTPT